MVAQFTLPKAGLWVNRHPMYHHTCEVILTMKLLTHPITTTAPVEGAPGQ